MKIINCILNCFRYRDSNTPAMSDPNIIFQEIEILRNHFRKSKAYFRYISEKSVGTNNLPTYNIGNNHTISLSFSEPITAEYREEHNSIGHYLNQNFIIRLCALLESHQVYGIWVDKDLPGNIELDILRRLRNRFAHSSGRYNPNKRDDRKLQQRIIEHFQVEVPPSYDDFPINQDKVIYPMIDSIREYVLAKNKLRGS